jgi:hypothetical protein
MANMHLVLFSFAFKNAITASKIPPRNFKRLLTLDKEANILHFRLDNYWPHFLYIFPRDELNFARKAFYLCLWTKARLCTSSQAQGISAKRDEMIVVKSNYFCSPFVQYAFSRGFSFCLGKVGQWSSRGGSNEAGMTCTPTSRGLECDKNRQCTKLDNACTGEKHFEICEILLLL